MSDRTGQPTEEPTQRKLQKARDDGQIVFSQEFTGASILTITLVAVFMFGAMMMERFVVVLNANMEFGPDAMGHPEVVLANLRGSIMEIGRPWLIWASLIYATVLFVGLVQTRGNISFKPIELNVDKLSPLKGIKRIFSLRSVNRTVLSIFKATSVITCAILVVYWNLEKISVAIFNSDVTVMKLGSDLLLEFLTLSVITLLVFGIMDYAFQWWKNRQELMMTKQEVRDEQKDIEGDPQMKARIRKLRNEVANNRMVQEVPTATVVVTNPTHFAVALRYIPGENAVPIVIAKGADHLAFRIIDIAKSHQISVVERKPVARFLYANVEVGQEIPYELYKAVAEILNHLNLADRKAGSAPTRLRG